MANLLELAADIVSAHASTTSMTKEELIAEIGSVYNALAALEKGEAVDTEAGPAIDEAVPAVTKRKAFGRDKIFCMLCGKGFTTLKRHLNAAHDMKPGEYRKRFDIPASQPLAAKNYSEQRKQMAIDRGLGDNLAKARAAKLKDRAAKEM